MLKKSKWKPIQLAVCVQISNAKPNYLLGQEIVGAQRSSTVLLKNYAILKDY